MAGREEGTKVWVGGLPDDAEKEELDRAFSEFGRLNNVWVARRPPGFAFVFFEDQRDAQDAVDKMDGSELFGRRIKVEISHGGRRGGGRRDFDRRGGYDGKLHVLNWCSHLPCLLPQLPLLMAQFLDSSVRFSSAHHSSLHSSLASLLLSSSRRYSSFV
eukprot:TRINITY_DN11220_c0_g1_i1.p1 TRINITY_DN11220_c0_g1~~TRINITY_DN11220_c0_g1_i1.p1  ORF type:complete len:159 (+),score=7.10 TRINITY_DN11220_c0_g1_i1:93-569(+)